MKNQLKTVMLCLSAFVMSIAFTSCQDESLDDISQENTVSQEQQFIETTLNGHPVTVEKIGERYYLGDIELLDFQLEDGEETAASKSVGRTGKRWPNNTITYAYDFGFGGKDSVEEVIAYYELFTNLTFVERKFSDYSELGGAVLLWEGSGCSANVGYFGDTVEHSMNLGGGCTQEVIIHEFGHVAGLWHEQNRVDRDQYVKINLNNVTSGYERQFATYVDSGLDGKEYTDFDFSSIMLYDSYTFSSNGKPTITKLDGSTYNRASVLSQNDLKGLDIMYPAIGTKNFSISKNGVYMSSEDGEKDITLDRTEVGEWELFEIVPVSGEHVYIKGNNGKYLKEESGGGYLRFSSSSMSNATKFRVDLGFYSSEYIAFQIVGAGRFIGTSTSGKLVSTHGRISGESVFNVEYEGLSTSGSSIFGSVAIKGNNNKYVSSENGISPMNCDRGDDLFGDWEKFIIIDEGDGLVSIRGNNGKYVSSENGKRSITCKRSQSSTWEKFTLIPLSNNKYAIMGNNKKYLSSENGTKPMTCTRGSIGDWEQFTIIKQ